jgi:hypothetical protein
MIRKSALAAVLAAVMVFSAAASADPYNPADRTIGGGLMGAGTGAIIGAIAGGGHDAGIGAVSAGGWVLLPARPPPRRGHEPITTITTSITANYQSYWAGLSK